MSSISTVYAAFPLLADQADQADQADKVASVPTCARLRQAGVPATAAPVAIAEARWAAPTMRAATHTNLLGSRSRGAPV